MILSSSRLQVADPLLDQRRSISSCFSPGPRMPTPIFMPREVGPHPLQPRQRVLELGQLDRQPGLVRLGAGGEDVEDQLGAVEHLHAGRLLQIAGLGGREVVVEDDHVGLRGGDQLRQLLELALAQVAVRVGLLQPLRHQPDHLGPGRFGQPREFLQRLFLVGPIAGKLNAHQHNLFAANALLALDVFHVVVGRLMRGRELVCPCSAPSL